MKLSTTPSALAELLKAGAAQVAPRLLNARITSVIEGELVSVRLTEVEAYGEVPADVVPHDEASHGARARTARNAVMFGDAGRLYVYFSYGMHWCANVVCGTEGVATAVLLRAGEIVAGTQVARRRRPAARTDIDLARGPARLAAALGLTGVHNGADLLGRDQAGGDQITLALGPQAGEFNAGQRVGISRSTQLPWRFWLAHERTVSSARSASPPRSPVS